MTGVKQFDRDEVLDLAMALFWERGYEATSIQDLIETTCVAAGAVNTDRFLLKTRSNGPIEKGNGIDSASVNRPTEGSL